jgi:hypothetical protein
MNGIGLEEPRLYLSTQQHREQSIPSYGSPCGSAQWENRMAALPLKTGRRLVWGRKPLYPTDVVGILMASFWNICLEKLRQESLCAASWEDRLSLVQSSAPGFPSRPRRGCLGNPQAKHCSWIEALCSGGIYRNYVQNGTLYSMGPWSKVVYYIRNRVLFGTTSVRCLF